MLSCRPTLPQKRTDMPLYEYACQKCGRFETLQKVSDGPLKSCPTCGAAVEKLLSAPAFQFKGSGWYVTDYARADAGTGSKDSGSKGSDSKPSEATAGSKESSTPPSADSKSSTNSPPKEGAGSAASSMAPAANASQ